MRLHFVQTHPLGRVTVKNPSNKIDDLPTQINGELNIDLQYLVVGLILIGFALKRSSSRAELVAEHPQTPHISPFVVKFACDYFRGDVVQSAAEGLALAE